MVQDTFEKIGVEGRVAYCNFLILDYVFIVCFLIVMLMISKMISNSLVVQNTLYILCILRAMFDCIENAMLIFMLNNYPVFNSTIAKVCSHMTTLKFIMLYSWLLIILVHIFFKIINKLSKI